MAFRPGWPPGTRQARVHALIQATIDKDLDPLDEAIARMRGKIELPESPKA